MCRTANTHPLVLMPEKQPLACSSLQLVILPRKRLLIDVFHRQWCC